MVIMDMAMVEKINKFQRKCLIYLIIILSIPNYSFAGDWVFTPNLGATETVTDNVGLNQQEESSLVSQFILGAEANYSSKEAEFSFAGSEIFVNYSQDSSQNDDYQTLQMDGAYSLWKNKLKAIISSSIVNVSINDANNSLADLVSADTVQQRSNSIGFTFNTTSHDQEYSTIDRDQVLDAANRKHLVFASLIYNTVNADDGIGEKEGYTAQIKSKNGTAARDIFWQFDGVYTNQKNRNVTSKRYELETKVGLITPYKLNPFIRVYDESLTGNFIGLNPDTVPSWGPGLRYLVAKHFIIDMSYNYVNTNSGTSDDYLAADIDWKPSQNTSLTAGYAKRFYGDSYDIRFNQKRKRLTNIILYEEKINVFERNNFQFIDDTIWCNTLNSNDCLPVGQVPDDTTNYNSVPITTRTLVEGNQSSLNKNLVWVSRLALARTDFIFRISNNESEHLNSGVIDNFFEWRFTIERDLSPRSSLITYFNHRRNIYDKHSLENFKQRDTYQTLSTTYNRALASKLNSFLTLQYVKRESNTSRLNYDELRTSINLTKSF